MCGSRKYPYPPHGWSLEIARSWGLKKSMKLNWNFQRGELRGGGKKKSNHPWGWGRNIFWNC